MITQQEFVADCYLDYAARGLEPGNPEHGRWNKCHYPTPKCLGGTECIWLLEEHHAIQGVLQSVEHKHPCVWTWERHYLTNQWAWLMPVYKYWFAQRGKIGGQISRCSREHYVLAGGRNKGVRKRTGHKVGSAPASDLQRETTTRRNIERGKERWQCTLTGFISTDSGLTRYQRNRSIDTSNRVQL
jgi:hypothetical protein